MIDSPFPAAEAQSTRRLAALSFEASRRSVVLSDMIPGYEILEEIGRGGMGVVYKARQKSLNRCVALKMIRTLDQADTEERMRFEREAKAIARLQHPNIVQVYDIGEVSYSPYFSLELIGGGNLHQKLEREGALGASEAAGLVEQLARAMHCAHAADVIHRDLKPSNILLTEEGSPRITDFGLAKHLNEVTCTTVNLVLGTPSYMAPEQAQGRSALLTPAVDIYALGAILYECLTARPPFYALSVTDTFHQVAYQDPVAPSSLIPGLPRDIETICLKCLEKDPHRRYATAEGLAEDLSRFQRGEPVLARPVCRWEKVQRWCKRNPMVACLLLVIALLLGVGSGISGFYAVKAASKARSLSDANAVLEKTNHRLEQTITARDAANRKLSREQERLERALSNCLLKPLGVNEGIRRLTREEIKLLIHVGKWFRRAPRGGLGRDYEEKMADLGLRLTNSTAGLEPTAEEQEVLWVLSQQQSPSFGRTFLEEALKNPFALQRLYHRRAFILPAILGLSEKKRKDARDVLFQRFMGKPVTAAERFTVVAVAGEVGGWSSTRAATIGEWLLREMSNSGTDSRQQKRLAELLAQFAASMDREIAEEQSDAAGALLVQEVSKTTSTIRRSNATNRFRSLQRRSEGLAILRPFMSREGGAAHCAEHAIQFAKAIGKAGRYAPSVDDYIRPLEKLAPFVGSKVSLAVLCEIAECISETGYPSTTLRLANTGLAHIDHLHRSELLQAGRTVTMYFMRTKKRAVQMTEQLRLLTRLYEKMSSGRVAVQRAATESIARLIASELKNGNLYTLESPENLVRLINVWSQLTVNLPPPLSRALAEQVALELVQLLEGIGSLKTSYPVEYWLASTVQCLGKLFSRMEDTAAIPYCRRAAQALSAYIVAMKNNVRAAKLARPLAEMCRRLESDLSALYCSKAAVRIVEIYADLQRSGHSGMVESLRVLTPFLPLEEAIKLRQRAYARIVLETVHKQRNRDSRYGESLLTLTEVLSETEAEWMVSHLLECMEGSHETKTLFNIALDLAVLTRAVKPKLAEKQLHRAATHLRKRLRACNRDLEQLSLVRGMGHLLPRLSPQVAMPFEKEVRKLLLRSMGEASSLYSRIRLASGLLPWANDLEAGEAQAIARLLFPLIRQMMKGRYGYSAECILLLTKTIPQLDSVVLKTEAAQTLKSFLESRLSSWKLLGARVISVLSGRMSPETGSRYCLLTALEVVQNLQSSSSGSLARSREIPRILVELARGMQGKDLARFTSLTTAFFSEALLSERSDEYLELLSLILSRPKSSSQREHTGLGALCLGRGTNVLGLAGLLQVAGTVEAPLSNQGIVDLIKQPTCYGRFNQVLLDHLGRRYEAQFSDRWALVRFARMSKLGLDFSPLRCAPQALRSETGPGQE